MQLSKWDLAFGLVFVLFKSLDFTETNVVLVTLIRLQAAETHSQVYDQGVNELN